MAESKTTRKREQGVGAAWRSRKGLYVLVSLDDVERRTGRTIQELRDLSGVQVVTRIYADGTRDEALRIPSELLADLEPPAGSDRR